MINKTDIVAAIIMGVISNKGDALVPRPCSNLGLQSHAVI